MAAGSTYTPIATTTLGSAASSVTFSSISGTYTDLILIMNTKNVTSTGYPRIQFNGDTSTNYSRTALSGDGSSAQSGRNANIAFCTASYNAASDTSNFNFNSICHIMNYSNTTTYKTVLFRSNNAGTGTDAVVNLWRKTPEAINSIYIFLDAGQYATGSTFTLYGIAAA